MVERVVKYKVPVIKICQAYRVSRPTFYKWMKRYLEVPEEQRLKAMREKKPKVKRYPRQTPELYEQAVLDIVAHYPQLGVSRITQVLPKLAGKPIVGYHGVQKILERHGLNTYEQRIAYAQTQITPVIKLVAALEGLGTRFIILPVETRVQLIKFASVILLTTFSTTVILGILGYYATIAAPVPLPSKIGFFFATVSLFVGSIFFAYSMKYYLTLAIVLSFSRQPLEEGGGYAVGLGAKLNNNHKNSNGNGNGGWLRRIFGLNGNGNGNGNGKNGFVQAGGLQPSLDHIKLKRYPFVSIHLPFYNEKKVAERILEACTSMDYPNYEVIVCDDSTDETVKIVQKYAKEHNKAHPKGPKIKILHRPTREGFKGGALRYAVKNMNPKTEFCVVFDADFIPYPDTLEMFIKYFKANNDNSENYTTSNIAVVGGYQWHVLNKSENWVTRGVRTEYAGSYVIERPGREILGLLKQISGSVYMIRSDVLKKVGWGTSITEDFQLTLKLYEQGYKVVYTPYVQAPAECVSTLKRLIRQRMRWAEGHSNCIKHMFVKLMTSPKLTFLEKLEVLYISPYYFQATFFLVGTFCWLLAETVFRARLPFWTSLWGWSLVLTNFFSLPLVNAVGLFLEESEEKDYLGLLSFIALSYIMVPFQAYASIKGFLEKDEGTWFRTPKSGKITDIFTRGKFYRWVAGILPGRRGAPAVAAVQAEKRMAWLSNSYVALATANNQFNDFRIKPKRMRWVSKAALVILLCLSVSLFTLAHNVSVVLATETPSDLWLSADASGVVTSPANWQLSDGQSDVGCNVATDAKTAKAIGWFNFQPGVRNTGSGDHLAASPTGYGWTFDTAFGDQAAGGYIGQDSGQWDFYFYTADNKDLNTGNIYTNVFRVEVIGNSITANTTKFFGFQGSNDIWKGTTQSFSETNTPGSQPFYFTSTENYLHVEFWGYSDNGANHNAAAVDFGVEQCGAGAADYPRIIAPAAQIPEIVFPLILVIPFLPAVIKKFKERRAFAA